jgi:hypothetical protein
MLKEKNTQREFLRTFLTSLILLVITTTLNYFIFLRQFRVNKIDKINEEKYRLLVKANDEFTEIQRYESDITFLDFYYDRMYKKWKDSLKLDVLPFEKHELLKMQLFQEHKDLQKSMEDSKQVGLKFLNTLDVADLLFKNEQFREKYKVLFDVFGTAERRKVYESYRNKYLISNNISLDSINLINPYAIADSMLKSNVKNIGPILTAMEIEFISE